MLFYLQVHSLIRGKWRVRRDSAFKGDARRSFTHTSNVRKLSTTSIDSKSSRRNGTCVPPNGLVVHTTTGTNTSTNAHDARLSIIREDSDSNLSNSVSAAFKASEGSLQEEIESNGHLGNIDCVVNDNDHLTCDVLAKYSLANGCVVKSDVNENDMKCNGHIAILERENEINRDIIDTDLQKEDITNTNVNTSYDVIIEKNITTNGYLPIDNDENDDHQNNTDTNSHHLVNNFISDINADFDRKTICNGEINIGFLDDEHTSLNITSMKSIDTVGDGADDELLDDRIEEHKL